MTWKERLADWISGGALSREMDAADELLSALSLERREADRMREHLLHIIHRGNRKSPNSTVKTMQALARKGLGEE